MKTNRERERERGRKKEKKGRGAHVCGYPAGDTRIVVAEHEKEQQTEKDGERNGENRRGGDGEGGTCMHSW